MITSMWMVQGMFYILTLGFYYSGSGIISLWIFMELNLLFFLMFIYFFETSNLENYFKLGLYYFLIQSMGSMYFLISIILNEMNYSISLSWVFSLAALTIKVGLFPFAFWVYEIAPLLSGPTFFVLLTLQKIPFLIILFTSSPDIELICTISFLMGSLMLFYSFNLDWLLISSSIGSIIWVYFLFLESEFSFYYFFFMYSFCLFSLLFCSGGLWRNFHTTSSVSHIYISMLFMFLMGLPPLSLFLFKLDISDLALETGKDIYMLCFLTLSILQLSAYFKLLYRYILFVNNLYGLKQSFNSVWSLIPLFFSSLPFIFMIF